MKTPFATIEDLAAQWRKMTNTEEERAYGLLESVSSELRTYAKSVGKDLDKLVAEDCDMKIVARSVCVDTVARILNQSTTAEAFTQMSQTAGSYTVSGTYFVPGGGSMVLKRDLARLGLRRQRFGVIDLC